MKIIYIVLCLLLVGIVDARSDELKGGHIGCLSEEAFEETMMAAARKDKLGFQHHFNKGNCIFPKAGLPISILDVGILSGRAKVRVYIGGQAFEMWTVIENIKRD